MRVMAVDNGETRIGVAFSDESRTLVGDAFTIKNKTLNETVSFLVDEANKRKVSCIVVGYPKNMDGSTGSAAQKSELLAEKLRSACDIDVVLWDERLTTVGAGRILSDVGTFGKKRKDKIDAVAAALILEGYLGSL